MDNQDAFYAIMGIFVGIAIGFFLWSPSQNSYVSQFEYNQLLQNYQELQKNYDNLKKDTASLVLEYYGKNTVLNFFGLRKHKIVICMIQEYLIGEIPLIKELC